MDLEDFKAELLRDGYEDVQMREIPANTFNDRHAHDFDVRALMLDGELTLAWDGQERTFRRGEVFVMEAGCPHVEQFGAAGARYLVGRRHAAV
ncbi:MAG TPA: cupin [Burkholderiales bacterium]|nr:cupin [Burkholderiales bacterium]